MASHYHDLGLLGRGGMGEVRRVHDQVLDRVLALKAVLPNQDQQRFIAEARVTARLQHPGIVPVHEMGQLDDGRVYFTMKEVRGRSFSSMIAAVHAASREAWHPTTEGWTLRTLIDAFARVCETLAYAHAEGVIHRDLKPDNVMVGEFGEVLVVDWGLALEVGSTESPGTASDSDGSGGFTMAGSLSGTPAYMAPEQATSARETLLPTADVWALGAILYEILAGNPPFGSDEPLAVLGRLLTESPRPFPAQPEPPDALTAAALCALSRSPSDRFPNAGAMAEAIRAWLQGADRTRRGLEAVARADAMVAEIVRLRARVDALRREAAAGLADVPAWEDVSRKEPFWEIEEQASDLERRAGLGEVAWLRELHGALQHDPDLGEAHQRLADHYRSAHEQCEVRRDAVAAGANFELLRGHDRGKNARYVSGVGALTVLTEPEGAAVQCFRVVERRHRLVEERWLDLGKTPIRAFELPVGSYVLVVTHVGHAPVRVPVLVEREGHAAAIPPGESAVRPIRLPRLGSLGPDDVFVPDGWFWAGGDPQASDSFPATRVWTDAFVIRRFPVTMREYRSFLQHLLTTEGPEAALAHAPAALERDRADGLIGVEHGALVARPDFAQRTWSLDWPVKQVDWHDASAFARWHALTTGRPWRLPHELEWEKAGRGADRRVYAWGDTFEPTWAATVQAFRESPTPTPVTAFPIDSSPYGVRGCVGNVRQWCGNVWERQPPRTLELATEPRPDAFLAARGGIYAAGHLACRLAGRYGGQPSHRFNTVGFRLAYTPSLETER